MSAEPIKLPRGSDAWRKEVLRLAEEAERLGVTQAAGILRMAEFWEPMMKCQEQPDA